MVKRLKESVAYKGINVSPLRPFTENDWYGWSGAEEFSNGDQPLIYENDFMIVIVDANGIEISCGDVDDPTTYRHNSTSFVKSLKLAKQVISLGTDDTDLLDFLDKVEDLGFEEL